MTDDSLDILHAGQDASLAAANRLGDRRIVAVNDDDSLRRLKGEKRPVNALEDRMRMLAFRDGHPTSRIIERPNDHDG